MKENSKHLLEIINIHTKWIKYNRKKIKELEKTIAETLYKLKKFPQINLQVNLQVTNAIKMNTFHII